MALEPKPIFGATAMEIIDRSYDHFEELAADVANWQLDFRQLSAGRRGHALLQLVHPGFSFTWARFQAPFEQRAISPPGLRTFSILSQRQPEVRWCGLPFTEETLVVTPRDGELTAISGHLFANYTFSIPETQLRSIAEQQFQTDWDDLAGESEASFRVPAPTMNSLRQTLAQLACAIRNRAPSIPIGAISSSCASAVINALLQSTERKAERRVRNRQRMISTVRDLIDHEIAGVETVADLCREAGVSERTLQYAFQELVGVSPKRYLLLQRLANVHRGLLFATPSTERVADVAIRFGFWHMGQFARDYRSVYGVNPSTTLKDSPKTRSH